MKNRIAIIACLALAGALYSQPTPPVLSKELEAASKLPPAQPAPPAVPYPQEKELADTKAALAQTQQQNQYLQILAERNELAVRLIQTQQQLAQAQTDLGTLRGQSEQAKTELALEKAKVEALMKNAPNGTGVSATSKPAPDPAKK